MHGSLRVKKWRYKNVLTKITPLIVTFNEEPNIARVLKKLVWAQEVVIIDSGSTDRTREIAAGFSNVRLVVRPFDSHAAQWNFGLKETRIQREWVLGLDSDYVLTDELINELHELRPGPEVGGYWVRFQYCISGKPLSGSMYPPVIALYRRKCAQYTQDGHTQRVVVQGQVGLLRSTILHDDRKPLSRWLAAQDRYAELECELLRHRPWGKLRWQDKIRRLLVVAPIIVPVYCLIWGRGIFDGWPGLYYALQRAIAEAVLSLKLLEGRFKAEQDKA